MDALRNKIYLVTRWMCAWDNHGPRARNLLSLSRLCNPKQLIPGVGASGIHSVGPYGRTSLGT